MSQTAVLVVGSLESILKTGNWVPALESPRTRSALNPFTGQNCEIETYLPDECAGDALDVPRCSAALEKVKPFSAVFDINVGHYDACEGKPVLVALGDDGNEYRFAEISDENYDSLMGFGLKDFDGADSVRTSEQRQELGVKAYVWVY